MVDSIPYWEKQLKWLVFVISLILVASLGYIDYLTGEYFILVFYLIPITLATWYVGCWQGILIALLSGFASFIVDYLSSNLSLLYWGSLQDTVVLTIFAIIIYVLRYMISR